MKTPSTNMEAWRKAYENRFKSDCNKIVFKSMFEQLSPEQIEFVLQNETSVTSFFESEAIDPAEDASELDLSFHHWTDELQGKFLELFKN